MMQAMLPVAFPASDTAETVLPSIILYFRSYDHNGSWMRNNCDMEVPIVFRIYNEMVAAHPSYVWKKNGAIVKTGELFTSHRISNMEILYRNRRVR
jgi:hypothetical protein